MTNPVQSQQIKLCYNLRGHVVNALSFMENEDDDAPDEYKAKRLEMALMNIKRALAEAEELLKALSEGQQERIVAALLENDPRKSG